ncbi:hypothetical protein KP79_PYT19277 [Mizuhopecten yessoensis]|uniref:Uncharacterized protein n=2 Tax=Mizuhopecten yessoensis TaxID=6573 RepID=A0A210PGH6_MIZYE|nr:hypothetical protein KP79_PYT19277 [Mizuhopecten yessoensis]
MADIETLQRQLDQQMDMGERRMSEHETVRLTRETAHERKFDKLYEMVEIMAKERSLVADDTPKPDQQQKVNQAFKATRMQLKERKPGPNKTQGTRPFKVQQLGLDF